MHDKDNLQCWDCGRPTEFDSLDELEKVEGDFPKEESLYYCPTFVDEDSLSSIVERWLKGQYYGLVYIETKGRPVEEVIDEMFED